MKTLLWAISEESRWTDGQPDWPTNWQTDESHSKIPYQRQWGIIISTISIIQTMSQSVKTIAYTLADQKPYNKKLTQSCYQWFSGHTQWPPGCTRSLGSAHQPVALSSLPCPCETQPQSDEASLQRCCSPSQWSHVGCPASQITDLWHLLVDAGSRWKF